MERIRPSKRLGQHFLVSRKVARVFSSWACRYRRLFEIGPGTGFITSQVLRDCKELELLAAIELDKRLSSHLAALSLMDWRLQPILSDALLPTLVLRRFDAGYGSIPYNITGPLLSLLVKFFQKPVLLLVQKEVADRLLAKPGTKNYGRVTILVNLVYEVKKIMTVPPTAFRPRPKVYSQIIELVPRRHINQDIIELVEELTRCFFSQRRKLARKAGRECLGGCAEKYIEDTIRVYELEPGFFLEVARKCAKKPRNQ